VINFNVLVYQYRLGHSIDEKARFYRMAKRSATECAAILDVCQQLKLVNEERYAKGRELVISIVSMLVKMAQKQL
jgi:four helix bundle protein